MSDQIVIIEWERIPAPGIVEWVRIGDVRVTSTYEQGHYVLFTDVFTRTSSADARVTVERGVHVSVTAASAEKRPAAVMLLLETLRQELTRG